MNKNLKKVISAVAALAISTSTFTALAANFPDVPENASYAQAVQELSALDVISGYDDGTFKPDELVTRAQITKMIVDARNERDMAEASMSQSKFADVSSDHWARGYINMGVADGFIAGYDATSFGPDDNVTYVQAQKMLVCALGYDGLANPDGKGWPNGYKRYASQQGIITGISGISDDTQLTRAQVAQMVDNAMGAPVCEEIRYEIAWDGSRVPIYEVKDGEGKGYQTLFTKLHNAYKVYGRVTRTNRMDNTLAADEIEFRVERADNFDNEYIATGDVDSSEDGDVMYYLDEKAPDLLLTYSQALIQKNDDDEFVILSITPAAANKTVTLAAEDYDSVKSTEKNLYFYPAGTTKNSVKYQIADDIIVYINGARAEMGAAELMQYIEDNDTASVTLQKETKPGSTSTDSYYNLIMVTSYSTAVVSEVQDKADTLTVFFDTYSNGVANKLVVNKDDENYTYTFTYEGAEIDPADLQEDDVLSIAWNSADGNKFADSNFYNVIVSRDITEGRCSSVGSSTPVEYNIDGTKYQVSGGMYADINAGGEYTLYLDHFGRIAKAIENSVNKKVGILKNIYKKAGGDWTVQIITKEGEEIEYKLKDAETATEYGKMIDPAYNGETSYDFYKNQTKAAAYPNQVVEYSVSASTNRLTVKEVLSYTDGLNSEYKANGYKIGSVKLGDSTIVLDLSEVEDDEIAVMSADNFIDGNIYDVYGYDRTDSGDRYYRFVLLMNGTASFNSETALAIYSGSESVNVDDDDRTAINVFIDGEEKQYVLKDDIAADDLEEGDAILFTVTGAGEVSKIETVFAADGMLNSYKNDYEGFKAKALSDLGAVVKAKPESKDSWADLLKGTSDRMDIVFGVAVNKSGNTISIAKELAETPEGEEAGSWVDYDAAQDYDCSGATIYTYNFGANPKASQVLVDNGLQVTTDVKNPRAGVKASVKGHDYLNLDAEEVSDDIVFAIARVDDDEVLEIYLIVSEA